VPTHSAVGSPTAAAAPPCANGAVTVSADREGALPGEELALLRFTNVTAAPCTLTGFPGVELLDGGRPIGKPAQRSGQRIVTLTLAPSATVAAQLHDVTRCNAPLSDQVGVYPPNQTRQLRAALELRACALTIDPVRR
jgi:hypothetical protein